MFGKGGLLTLQGIVNGMPGDEIIKVLPRHVRKKIPDLTEILQTTISPEAIYRLRHCLNFLKCLKETTNDITAGILHYATEHFEHEMQIFKSVPGIGNIAAVTLLAEIGNFSDFPSGEKLASWLELVPNVYQSADTLRTGGITKRGSKDARWILIQSAHAVARSQNNDLRRFFDSKKAKIGTDKTIVALARKIVVMIWHLITYDEFFDHRDEKTSVPLKFVKVKIPALVTLEEILKSLHEAAVVLKEPNPRGG